MTLAASGLVSGKGDYQFRVAELPSLEGAIDFTCSFGRRPMIASIERQTMKKVYLRILPFCFVLYFICYLDRVNIGFAALTMNKDLGLSSYIFGLGAGAFFWGYFILEVPSNLILDRVGLGERHRMGQLGGHPGRQCQPPDRRLVQGCHRQLQRRALRACHIRPDGRPRFGHLRARDARRGNAASARSGRRLAGSAKRAAFASGGRPR
jgi:hypothetical protein